MTTVTGTATVTDAATKTVIDKTTATETETVTMMKMTEVTETMKRVTIVQAHTKQTH